MRDGCEAGERRAATGCPRDGHQDAARRAAPSREAGRLARRARHGPSCALGGTAISSGNRVGEVDRNEAADVRDATRTMTGAAMGGTTIRIERVARRRDGVPAAILVIGAFAVVLAATPSDVYDLERYLVPKELMLGATALACLALLAPRWRRIEAGAVDVMLAAFVAWTALSAAAATNPWFALRGFGVTYSALVVYATAAAAARAGRGRAVLAGVAAAATLGGALGVAQAYGADWAWLAESRPPGGTFGNRNFLAHLMAIGTPVFLLLVLRGRGFAAALGYLGVLVAAAAIVLTRSRAAWLGGAAAFGVFAAALALARGSVLAGAGRRRAVAAAVLLAAGGLAAILVPNRLEWRSTTPYAETLTGIANYREGSGRGRLIQYGNTLDMVRFAPVFGVGPGNWFVHYPRVTTAGDPSFAANDPIPTNPWPSSDWVALLAERGAIGVLLALLAGGAIVLTAARRLAGGDADAAASAAALLGVLAAATITGAFDAVLMLPAPAYFVAAVTGTLLPSTRPVAERLLEGRKRRGAVIGTIAIATVLVLTSAGQIVAIRAASAATSRDALDRAVRFYPGDHRLRLILARRGRCTARLPHARAAAELMPWHDAPRRALRACGVRE